MQLFAFVSPILFAIVVAILGFVTPDYSHINHTISRLAIEQYGWVQILNFLQFAAGLAISGIVISRSMQHETSRRIIRTIFSFCASLLVLAALVPTDPIETMRFSFRLLTPTGSMHVGTVIVFLLVSPLGISRLVRALGTEPDYRRYAAFTAFVGYTALIASIAWFGFYMTGLLLEYRGIFQKAIALLVILWIDLIVTISSSKERA